MTETETMPVHPEGVTTDMRTLVLEITKALVDEPGAVRLDTLSEGGTTVLRLQVSAKDLGKVIGKQGRTARSLRTILGAASMKLKQRFSLDIVEVPPVDGPPSERTTSEQ